MSTFGSPATLFNKVQLRSYSTNAGATVYIDDILLSGGATPTPTPTPTRTATPAAASPTATPSATRTASPVAEKETLMTTLEQFVGLPFRNQADALQVFDEALAVGFRRIGGSRRSALTGRGELCFEIGERFGYDRGLKQTAFLHKLQIFVAG